MILSELTEELHSGKLESLKEEEFKSRFINSFFGDVLGFDYSSANKWLLREEKKTQVDGTKPDVALGYFLINKEADDVRIIIEIKDANTDLDEKQKRKDAISPVDQAFAYAPKMGGNCRWVIVSNFKEIRFYSYFDRSKYQVFLLKDLTKEEKLKELLYLFSKDRLMHSEGKSPTEKLLEYSKKYIYNNEASAHILDELYACVKKFNGLECVDPNFLASIYPFNILDEHVWHYDINGTLFTLNSRIYQFLKGIEITNGHINLSDELEGELIENTVVDYAYKIKYVFKFLSKCLVNNIKAVRDYQDIESSNKNSIGFSCRIIFPFSNESGIERSISFEQKVSCECLRCTYRSLNFTKFFEQLKAAADKEENTLEYAYASYLAASNDFKTSKNVYKTIEQQTKNKEGGGVTYFLCKLNTIHLHNLLSNDSGNEEVLREIRAIDLPRIIYEELEFSIDSDVKKYLLELYGGNLLDKTKDILREKADDAHKLRLYYKSKQQGMKHIGPHLPNEIWRRYYLLHAHTNANYLVSDVFTEYRYVAKLFFSSLVDSYLTKGVGLTKFNDFILFEAILHISNSDIKEILSSVKSIAINENELSKLLLKLSNFLISQVKITIFNDSFINNEMKNHLSNMNFSEKIREIFSNFFVILSYVDINSNLFEGIPNALNNYLMAEDELSWNDIKCLGLFIYKKGNLFSENNLRSLLQLAIGGERNSHHKHQELIQPVCIALATHYSNFIFSDKALVRRAVANCYSVASNRVSFKHLIPLWPLLSNECKVIMHQAFTEVLDEEFNADIYDSLIRHSVLDFSEKDYFAKLICHVNNSKGKGLCINEKGKIHFDDYKLFDFALIIYIRNIEFNNPELVGLQNLSQSEQWLMNPEAFDYSNFNSSWLVAYGNEFVLSRVKHIQRLKIAVEESLKEKLDFKLYKIYHKYFKSLP